MFQNEKVKKKKKRFWKLDWHNKWGEKFELAIGSWNLTFLEFYIIEAQYKLAFSKSRNDRFFLLFRIYQ